MNDSQTVNAGPGKIKLNRAERVILGVLERKLGMLVANGELEARLDPALPASGPGVLHKRISSIKKKLGARAVIHSFKNGTHIMVAKSWPRQTQTN